MPSSLSIASYDPAALQSAAGSTLDTAPSWTVQVRTSDRDTFWLALRAPAASALVLDAVLAPIVAADLLRAGWTQIARPFAQPVISAPRLYHGFRLQRPVSLPVARGELWTLECLIPSDLTLAVDWPAVVRALDGFALTVFSEAPRHD